MGSSKQIRNDYCLNLHQQNDNENIWVTYFNVNEQCLSNVDPKEYNINCNWVWVYMYLYIVTVVEVLVTQLCPTLCDAMNCSPPGSSVQGLL